MSGAIVGRDGLIDQFAGRLRRRAAGFARVGTNLLFPPRCAACKADLPQCGDDLLLCDDCRRLLGPESRPRCPRCAAACADCKGTTPKCGACRGANLKFDSAITLGVYEKELRDAVLRMKRASHETLSAAMGQLLTVRMGEQLSALGVDLVVPVPMYWARRLKRGTNSPEILASVLARSLRIPIRRRVLLRRRNTLPQAGLSPTARLRNVRGAFGVRAGYCSHPLKNARVLLVDDILTTGATCSEAARVIKRAGATMVAAVVVARVARPNAT